MKKFVVIIGICMCMIGCTSHKNPLPPSELVKKYNIEKVEYEGHDYVIFKEVGGYCSTMSVLHSPECSKCKNN